MSDRRQARFRLLSLATEDAYVLFWAVGIVGKLFPENTKSQNQELAVELLRDLIEAGLVVLLIEKNQLLPPVAGDRHARFSSEYSPVVREDVEAILSAEQSWEPFGPGDEGVAFSATEAGRVEYGLPASNG